MHNHMSWTQSGVHRLTYVDNTGVRILCEAGQLKPHRYHKDPTRGQHGLREYMYETGYRVSVCADVFFTIR